VTASLPYVAKRGSKARSLETNSWKRKEIVLGVSLMLAKNNSGAAQTNPLSASAEGLFLFFDG